MSSDTPDPFDEAVTSAEDLDMLLRHVLRSAHENGVDPRGSWVMRNGHTVPDWEVQIHELEKQN